MDLGFAAILFPLSMLFMLRTQKGPVRKFMTAGAVSAETARRPGSIEINLTDRLHLDGLVRRRVLSRLDDGRYFVNVAIHRRRRRLLVTTVIVLFTTTLAFVLFVWPAPIRWDAW